MLYWQRHISFLLGCVDFDYTLCSPTLKYMFLPFLNPTVGTTRVWQCMWHRAWPKSNCCPILCCARWSYGPNITWKGSCVRQTVCDIFGVPSLPDLRGDLLLSEWLPGKNGDTKNVGSWYGGWECMFTQLLHSFLVHTNDLFLYICITDAFEMGVQVQVTKQLDSISSSTEY